MAESQAIHEEELSEPNSSSSRDSTNPASFAISLDPGTRSSRWGLEWLVFASSVAVHVAICVKVRNNVTPQVTRFVTSQVDIELAPPVIEEPKVKEPAPPADPPPPSDKPIPRVQSHAPVAQAAAAVPDNSGLPSSDDGLLEPTPPGTGSPGPAPVLAPAPPPPPPPPPPPAPVIQAKVGADFARKPNLEYPRLARREEWEGTVILRAQVLPSGKVGSVTVQKSSGHSVLDDAALSAAKTWSFVPATQGGNPVAGTVTFPVQFKLQ
ncbi:MAG TPA: energy transducer TonB [Polyangiaceae bacterium]|nr:energy transducer TonB [Polyangiaceae bacterium]